MKLGVYIPTYRSPVALRSVVLQVLAQTRQPDVLSIFEDHNPSSYRWAIKDLDFPNCSDIELKYAYYNGVLHMPSFFEVPLRALYDADCDLFIKLDDDDIVYNNHLETIENQMHCDPEAHWVVGARSDLLVLLANGGHKHKESINFGVWNPTGGQPNSTMFDREACALFLAEMEKHPGLPEDWIFSQWVMPVLYGRKFDIPATSCYVSHGKNASTSHWSTNPPPEVL